MQVPGAVVLVRTGDHDFTFAYGTRTLEGKAAVTADDRLRVGSNTKTWTGTVILQLVQEGQLSLQDKVDQYLPDVPNGGNITIAHLLNMRSGLFNYSETLALNQTLDREPQKAWQPPELLALAFAHKAYFDPGEGYHYSNTNTVLLGLIAEKLDRAPLSQIFARRLFEPLGLQRTSFPDPASNALAPPHSHGYMYGNNVLTMGSPPAVPAEMQAAARAGSLKPGDFTTDNPSWAWAAGAGISTANELAIWVEAVVQGRLLGKQLQQQRLDSVLPTDPDKPEGAAYGLALAKMGPFLGHTGELPGFNSFMGHDPEHGVTLVVWTNLAPAADGRDPATTIARALTGLLYRRQTSP